MLIDFKCAEICVAGKRLLSDVTFHVDAGEFVYLVGKVGSGKSSFLMTLYGEIPFRGEGEGEVLGVDLRALRPRHLPALRRKMGIVFQDFQLLRSHTAAGNIDFVLRATGWKKKAAREERIARLLEEVELSDKADAYPHELSGGEQQRLCIARALINNPQIILADEPTANLDEESSAKVMSLLRRVCDRGTAVVMVTHNLGTIQQYPGVVYQCADGAMLDVTDDFNVPVVMNIDDGASLG